MLTTLQASAVIPSLLLIYYFYSRDVHPEPGPVLIKTFVLGVLTVIPVLMTAIPMNWLIASTTPQSPYAMGLADAVLTAAVPEEFFKFLVVWFYCARHPEFDEPMDGVVYGVTASLGFATLENILYVSSGGLWVAVMRALTAVPGHAMMGALMGYYVGQAKFNPDRKTGLILKAYLVPTIMHALYDFPLISLNYFNETKWQLAPGMGGWLTLSAIAVLVVMAVWVLVLVRGLRKDQLARLETLARSMPSSPMQLAFQPGPAPPQPQYGARPSTSAPSAPSAEAAPYLWTQHQVKKKPTFLGWVLMIFGGLLATFGGLVIFFGFWGMIVEPQEWVPFLIGIAIIGLLPVIVGVVLFTTGIRMLNRHGPKPMPRPRRIESQGWSDFSYS